MLTTSLLMVHNTLRGSEDNMTELTAGKEVAGPHLNFIDLNIETRRDATTLVETTNKVNNNLTRTVVIDDGDFTNVTYSIIPII
jgi:hypothetical protein